MAGHAWVEGFMQHYPMIASRKAQNLNPGIAQNLNRFIVNDYFPKLKTTLEELGVMNKLECIYIVQENGCRLCLHKRPLVMIQKGRKRINLVAAEHGKNVTIMSCGNAVGSTVTPMIQFKGQRMKGEWLSALTPGSIAQLTTHGSMTTEAFVNWFTHFIYYKVAWYLTRQHHIRIIAKWKRQTAMILSLLCLPSQTTHELQPVFKPVFEPFEHY